MARGVFGPGLLALRLDRLARSDHLDRLPLLNQQFVALVRELQLRVEMRDAVAELHFHDLLAHQRGLFDHRQSGPEFGDDRGDLVGLGILLRDLLVERGELCGLLLGLRDHGGFGARHLIRRRFRWRREGGRRRRGIQIGAQGHQPRHIEPRPQQVMADPVAIRQAGGAIEFDQDISGLDAVAIPDIDRRHHAGLQRLDHLDAADRHDLSLRGGDDVDASEGRPGQRDDEECNHRSGDGASRRGRRRLDDLQCGRQECTFGAAHPRLTPQRHHIAVRRVCFHCCLSRLHEALPACDGAWRNARHCG